MKHIVRNVSAMAAFLAVAIPARSIKHSAGAPGVSKGVVTPTRAPAFRLVIEQPGNEARYRVREQLVGKDLENDAVGVTPGITGEIDFADDGTVIPDGSKITIDVSALKSDQTRRDNYVRTHLLETATYPTVVFQPTSVRGAPKTLPTTGGTAFSLIGNLTVKGVTKPATWFIAAKFGDASISGSASTSFTFADFSIPQPKVPVLLSVADTIKLEYDFNMVVKK